ncbi:hypothetical protein I553_2928 [Mycobacterium xenopi 4042]|uniref:Uncharacterized protein n=1 Tax=Mycobacterium xenopi 4042 TaxID=1299334 RepID=X8EF56_MYCXE|nr:hypothetical protein I553_2928 [Mycobacterium xenopi 4042]
MQLVAHVQRQLQIKAVRVRIADRGANPGELTAGAGSVRQRRTAIDSGPCAAGSEGSSSVTAPVTRIRYPISAPVKRGGAA